MGIWEGLRGRKACRMWPRVWTCWCGPFIVLIVLLGHACSTELERFKRTIIGYYPVCPRGCASCSTVNGCVTCRPRLFLLLQRDGMRQRGVCVHACPGGFYGVRRREYSKCHMCTVEHCEACFSRSYCTRCTQPYLAFRGQCIEKCPADNFYAEYSKECVQKADCAVNQWAVWGVCMRSGQTCGFKYGLQVRTREVIQLPSPNGQKCPITTETRRCRMKYRSCVDLLHNNSDPSRSPMSRDRKRKHKGRRRKKGRDKNPDGRKRKRQRLAQTQDAERRRRRRRRNRKNRLRPFVHDVTTNQINLLLPDP